MLALLLVLLGCGQLTAGERPEQTGELPEDCSAKQFFNPAQGRCQECSDVMRIFEGANAYPAHPSETTTPATSSSSETSASSKPTEARAAILAQLGQRLPQLSGGTTAAKRKNMTASGGQTPAPTSKPRARQQASAILSRLVMKSTSNRQAAGEELDPEASQGATLSSPGDQEPAGEEALEPVGKGEQADGLARQTKHWLKLLNRFVQSREFQRLEPLEALLECRHNLSTSACQMWSNLCVLTMYAHSADGSSRRFPAGGANSASPASQQAPARLSSQARRTGSMAGGDPEARTSWQKCPRFALTSLCNSLRDWHAFDKQQAQLELNDIYAAGEDDVTAGAAVDELASGLAPGAPTKAHAHSPDSLKVNQPLQLLAYKYALDGRLLEVSQFSLADMGKFCLTSAGRSPDRTQLNENLNLFLDSNFFKLGGDIKAAKEEEQRLAELIDALKVGQNLELSCRFTSLEANLFAPQNVNETQFVELFVARSSTSTGAMFIKAVPVLNEQLLFNQQLVNLRFAQDPSRWRLVHRFFAYATLKLETPTRRQDGVEHFEEEVLVYAKQSNLELTFRRQQDRGLQLSSIFMRLEYDHLPLVRWRLRQNSQPANSSADTDIQLDKSVHSSQVRVNQVLLEMQLFRKDFDMLLTILCLVSCIWSLVKCYNVQKYQGLIKLDIHALWLFLIICCDIIANVILLVSLSFGLYLFAGAKLITWPVALFEHQALMAPGDELESTLALNLKLALILKLASLAHKFYTRLRADIFFIDWERPKMLTSTQLLNHGHAARPKASHEAGGTQTQISFWRRYSVIDRWLRMQTSRRLNLTLQLLLFGLLVHHLRVDELASADSGGWRPRSTGSAQQALGAPLEPKQSDIFRSILVAALYLALATLQIAYKKYVHEPMLRSRVREFIDFCSVANVSLFAMLYPRLGFYIHGRNANGSSECGIGEMNALLEREERDLCSKRGLVANSDQQTFVLVLPKIINDHYRKLLFHTTTAEARPKSPLALSSTGGHQRSLIETVVARNRAVNAFLINYLEHIYKDIDYQVREPKRFGSLLMEIDLDSSLEADDTPTKLRGAAAATAASAGGALATLSRDGGGGRFFGGAASEATNRAAAKGTFFIDPGDSFTSLLWLGLEWDLVLAELLLLLSLDRWLGAGQLLLTVSAIWLTDRLFQWLYASGARSNLIVKSMLDEKFLIR